MNLTSTLYRYTFDRGGEAQRPTSRTTSLQNVPLNLIENEFHLLTKCPAYDDLRASLLSAVNFERLDPDIQFSNIMRSENTAVIRRLTKFIIDA